MSTTEMLAPENSRQSQKAQTRQRLLRAAERCFERLGYAVTKIAHIAKEAGVAHGTIYVHFANKEALLDELLARFNAELAARMQPVVAAAPGQTLDRTVRRTAEIFLAFWEERRGFVECYAERTAAGLDLTSLRDGINPPMLGLLTGGLQAVAGGRGPDGARWDLVTHGLLALWLRLGLQYLFNERVGRVEVLDTLVAMTLGAVDAVARKQGETGDASDG